MKRAASFTIGIATLAIDCKNAASAFGRRHRSGDGVGEHGSDVGPEAAVRPACVKQEPEREAFASV